EQSQRFIQAAALRPEISGIQTLFRPSSPQIFLDIDDGKALKLGVPLRDINTSVGAFLGGAYVNDFNRFGRLYKVYVQAEPEYRNSIDGINMFYVRNNKGDSVPLSTLVETSRSWGPEFTNRFNLFRAAKLTGQPAPGYSSSQALAALEEVASETLPSDMGYSWSDMSYQEKAAEGS
ncbi:MAG: hydrophobe/amphiphile efflux-1 family RND transporter, partial [Halieaceae bacterium]|nr:hydrophobe/amphiphile efflux-1 family RND transporter [Halieaceae bacterium]